MQWLQLIKKHEAEFADVLGVLLVILEAATKAAGAEEQLSGLDVVAMRFLAGKGIAGNLLKETFADTDGGDKEVADVQIAAESDEDDGGNAHDIGAVAANAVGLHAVAKIAFQDIGEAFAQKRNFQSWEAFATRTGGDV